MRDFKRKKLIKNIVFSYFTIGFLLILIVLMAMSVFERFSVERQMAERRAEAEAELESLRLRAAALESQVEYLDEERGIEAEIRNRFDVVKEGEQVVIILDDSEPVDSDDTETPLPPEEPWYKFW